MALAIASLLLAVGWGCTREATGPVLSLCEIEAGTSVGLFGDPNLEAAVRTTLSVGPLEDLTCDLLETLTNLNAGHLEITSLAGIENLTGLTFLWIRGNSITDIRQLAGLTGLTFLNLAANSLTDVGPLSGLTSLTFLAINDNRTITDISALRGLTNLTGTLWMGGNSISDLSALSGLTNLTAINAWENSISDLSPLSELDNLRDLNAHANSISDLSPLSGLTDLTGLRVHLNSITDVGALRGLINLTTLKLQDNSDLNDIQPLLENAGLGSGDTVWLTGTAVSCSEVAALGAKGVTVLTDCP